ncbi:zf-HC2 domain-containing protein [Neisseriaceae bacterium B1]
MKSCKEITRLSAKHQEQALSVKERMQLKIHLLICSKCRRYYQQIGWLDNQLKKIK